MAPLPKPQNTTRELIYQLWEKHADHGFREHLGASIIGRPCSRSIWYSFRWATIAQFPGRILRLFQRGKREEQIFIDELRGIGVDVREIDPRTGKQWQYSTLGGHFGGSGDGVAISGVPEAPKTPHVLEFKTHGDKSFKDLAKNGVEKSKPEHFAQMQTYMGLGKYDRALYLAVNKNDDEIHAERVEFRRKDFEQIVERARMIIASDRPPAKISDDPAWFQCNFCDHRATCHSTAVPPPTCRSCMHSTPVIENSGGEAVWRCEHHGVTLDKSQQLAGCAAHVYNPTLLENWADVTDAIDANVEFTNRATGKRFLNGPPSPDGLAVYSSIEIYRATDKSLIGDDFVGAMKVEFGTHTEVWGEPIGDCGACGAPDAREMGCPECGTGPNG